MYKDFFGLNRNPFELSPDPSFMCPSEKSKEALTSIMYAVAKRKGFVVMTGEAGTGKTLIVRSLFELWKSKGIAFANMFAPRLPVIDFLINATSDLGIKVTESTKGNLLRALYGFLVIQYQKGLTTVLVIDEAHQIPTTVLEEIRMLTNVETNQQKLVQVLLVGQPELDRKLDSFELRQLKQRIAIRCQLEPLREEETRQYIERRLNLAGANSQANTIFPTETVNIVHRYSRGIPRLVNSICDQALAAAYALQVRVVPFEIIEEVASHFRLDLAPNLKQTKKLFSMANQIEKSVPDKSWQAVPTLNVPAVKAPDPGASLRNVNVGNWTQTPSPSKPETSYGSSLWGIPGVLQTDKEDSTSHQLKLTIDRDMIREVSADFDFELLICADCGSTAAKATAGRSATAAGAPEGVERSDGKQPTAAPPIIPASVPAAEPISLAPTATQSTSLPNPPWLQPRPRSSIGGLEPVLRALGRTLTHVRVWAEESVAILKKVLLAGATVVLLSVTIGGVMLRRQGRLATPAHQIASTPKNLPVETTITTPPNAAIASASVQPATATSAMRSEALWAEPTVARSDSESLKLTSAAGKAIRRPKIAIGKLSRPMIKSPVLSISSEAPSVLSVQANVLPIGNGLLDSAVNGPAAPGVDTVSHLEAPKLVSSPQLVYPSLARIYKVQGVVVIDALVDATGKVADMKVISGSARLTQAAMDALRTWKYQPARLNGQPIATHTQVKFEFSLN